MLLSKFFTELYKGCWKVVLADYIWMLKPSVYCCILVCIEITWYLFFDWLPDSMEQQQ